MKKAQIRSIINWVYYIVVGFLLARVVSSWIPELRSSGLGSFIYSVTDPMLAPIDKLLPSMGGFSFSVIILWFALGWVRNQLLRKFS